MKGHCDSPHDGASKEIRWAEQRARGSQLGLVRDHGWRWVVVPVKVAILPLGDPSCGDEAALSSSDLVELELEGVEVEAAWMASR